MQESEPLKRMLENLGKHYAGREINVEFDDQPRITQDGETIYVWSNPADVLDLNISPANEFRLVRNTLDHETAHDRWSDLSGKATFSARYPEHSKLAGALLNRLEDSYIDSRRLAERPGLRGAQAFFCEAQTPGGDGVDLKGVDELPTEQALVRAIDYYALVGRVPGIRNADDDVRQFAAWVKPHVEEYRRTDDTDGREAIAARIMDELVDRLPDSPDLDDLDDLADAIADAASGELPDDETVENMPDMNLPDDADLDDALPDSLDDLDEPQDADEQADGGDETGEGDETDADAPGGEQDGDEAGDDDTDTTGGTSGDEGGEDGEQDEQGGDAPADGESGETGEQGDEASDGQAGDAETDAEPEQGRNKGTEQDLADALDELDELDEAGESTEWHGVDDGEDYTEATESDERRYERVENSARFENETAIGKRKADRDEKAEAGNTVSGPDATSDEVRQVLRETGLADDIRRAFEKFATLDITETSDTGDRVNVENAVRHMSGDYSTTDVYETDYTADSGGRVIGVSLDLSYSMDDYGSDTAAGVLGSGHGAIVDAKTALGAVHLAAHELGDDLVASGFHKPSGARTPLITGPGESFKWEHLDAVSTKRSGFTDTPTAHGVLDTLDLIEQAGGRDRIMLVITDGMPQDGHHELSGNNAAEDARQAVELARKQGVGVIGVGVGRGVDSQGMSDMFGEDGYILTESDELVSDLVDLYADELDYERPAGY